MAGQLARMLRQLQQRRQVDHHVHGDRPAVPPRQARVGQHAGGHRDQRVGPARVDRPPPPGHRIRLAAAAADAAVANLGPGAAGRRPVGAGQPVQGEPDGLRVGGRQVGLQAGHPVRLVPHRHAAPAGRRGVGDLGADRADPGDGALERAPELGQRLGLRAREHPLFHRGGGLIRQILGELGDSQHVQRADRAAAERILGARQPGVHRAGGVDAPLRRIRRQADQQRHVLAADIVLGLLQAGHREHRGQPQRLQPRHVPIHQQQIALPPGPVQPGRIQRGQKRQRLRRRTPPLQPGQQLPHRKDRTGVGFQVVGRVEAQQLLRQQADRLFEHVYECIG